MTYEKEDFLSPDDYDNAMSLIKALSKINLKEYTLNHIYDGILKEPEFIFSGKEFLLKTKEYSTILIGCTFCPETDKIQYTEEMLDGFFKDYALVKTFNIRDLR